MLKSNLPAIILVNPQLPENIGLSARAMSYCGFDDLRVIRPREGWPNKIANKSAANAEFIIKKAKIFNNFDDAVSDLNFLIATSVRERFLNKNHYFEFNQLINNISKYSKIGIVFGPEKSGLTNANISKCDCIFSLPILKNKLSLNLSQSILIICYEYSKLKNKSFTDGKRGFTETDNGDNGPISIPANR